MKIEKLVTKHTGNIFEITHEIEQDGYIQTKDETGFNRLFHEDDIIEIWGKIAVVGERLGYVANKPSGKGYICIGGVRKKELLDCKIPKKDIHSEHDYGNWVFYIPIKYLRNMGWNEKEIQKMENRR
jgi:hypothetical protein